MPDRPSERGRCPSCSAEHALTKRGAVRVHALQVPLAGAPAVGRIALTMRGRRCAGSGKAPQAAEVVR